MYQDVCLYFERNIFQQNLIHVILNTTCSWKMFKSWKTKFISFFTPFQRIQVSPVLNSKIYLKRMHTDHNKSKIYFFCSICIKHKLYPEYLPHWEFIADINWCGPAHLHKDELVFDPFAHIIKQLNIEMRFNWRSEMYSKIRRKQLKAIVI